MKIAVINTLPIPSGEASVNRLLSYSKELVALGNTVSVLSAGRAKDSEGVINGVSYKNYGCKRSLLKLCFFLSEIKRGKYDRIIIVSNSLLLILPMAVVAKLTNTPLLQEKSEYPFVLMKKGLFNRIYGKLYVNTTYRLFDGMIVMTKPLMEFYAKYVKKNCKLFEMPMTVDIDRFNIEPQENQIGDYLAYCGNLSNKKDGILNLIEAFSMVEPLFPQIKLVLIGGTENPKDIDCYKDEVANLKLSNVVFYGKVDRNDIPSLLKNAKALLLARPSSLQSTGGFPTKLGEYLATGNPVVVTAVGDIPLYLNESNSFIVAPDDNMAFAEMIIKLLKNETHAFEVGKAGQLLAMTVFNAKLQTRKLDLFLRSL